MSGGGNRNGRLINLDDRAAHQPDDVTPIYDGDSVGKWEGDAFVANTPGFNDLGWLDVGRHGHSEDLSAARRKLAEESRTKPVLG